MSGGFERTPRLRASETKYPKRVVSFRRLDLPLPLALTNSGQCAPVVGSTRNNCHDRIRFSLCGRTPVSSWEASTHSASNPTTTSSFGLPSGIGYLLMSLRPQHEEPLQRRSWEFECHHLPVDG